MLKLVARLSSNALIMPPLMLLLLLLLHQTPATDSSGIDLIDKKRPLMLPLSASSDKNGTAFELRECANDNEIVSVTLPEISAVLNWHPQLRLLTATRNGNDISECRFASTYYDSSIRLRFWFVKIWHLVVVEAKATHQPHCLISVQTEVQPSLVGVIPFVGCVLKENASQICWGKCQPSFALPRKHQKQQQQELIRKRRATAVCNDSECLNNGFCPGRNVPYCSCPTPYLPPKCADLVNYCSTPQSHLNVSLPVCLNGANCSFILAEPYFNCSCVLGFTGWRCEINIDDCESKPCLNGACTDLVNNYSCSCDPGWTGYNCSINIDECQGDPCRNGAQCIDGINSYTCNCTDTGFRGPNCTENINDCDPNPCANGGVCSDGIKNYSCECNPGFSGKNCSVDFADCRPDGVCQNGGICLERSNSSLYSPSSSLPPPFNGIYNVSDAAGFVCNCLPGSSGTQCEINPNDCLLADNRTSVCQRASGCTDGLNDYTCHCLAGFTGKNCSIEIDECALWTPCQNAARCNDLVANYSCECVGNFGGRNCSVSLTACDSNPCANSANCRPILLRETPSVVQDFVCECTQGWTGRVCNVTTLVSLADDSGAAISVAFNSTSTSSSDGGGWWRVSFRTTLADTNVANVSGEWGSVQLAIVAKQLQLSVANASSSLLIGQLSRPIASQLAAAAWTRVAVNLRNGTSNIDDSFWGVAELLSDGAVDFNSEQRLSLGGSGWRGCFRDASVDSDAMVTPDTTSAPAWGSCPRTDPCSPTPCSAEGTIQCVDNWNEASCLCRPEFGGVNCSAKLPDFTFARDATGVGSLTYSLPAAGERRQLQLQLVTLSRGTFVFFMASSGSALVGGLRANGALWLELQEGNVTLTSVESTASVASGRTVLLFVTFSSGRLTLSLDDKPEGNATLSGAATSGVVPLLQAGTELVLGGFAGATAPATEWRGRSRRAVAPLPSGVRLPEGTTGFKGVLGAIKVDGRALVGGGNVSGLPGALVASDVTGVTDGAVTDSICKLKTPCANGAKCTNAFYNSYNCSCSRGWTGSNCTQQDYCDASFSACSTGSECVNLVETDGFECRGDATLGYNLTSLSKSLTFSYNATPFQVSKFSGRVRTRQLNGNLLTVSNGGVGLELRLSSGKLVATVGGVSVTLDGFNASNGQWVQFSLRCTLGQLLNLTVAKVSSFSSSNVTASPTVDSSVSLSAASADFKGCAGDWRLNEHLLPVVPPRTQLGTSRFVGTHSAGEGSSVLIGCQSDPVCWSSASDRCMNGATCKDLWNLRLCECRDGYSGERCSVPDCSKVTCFGTASASLPLIIGLSVAALLVIVAIIAFALVRYGRKRRAESGLYKPSKQEGQHGQQLGTAAIKPPTEERLI